MATPQVSKAHTSAVPHIRTETIRHHYLIIGPDTVGRVTGATTIFDVVCNQIQERVGDTFEELPRTFSQYLKTDWAPVMEHPVGHGFILGVDSTYASRSEQAVRVSGLESHKLVYTANLMMLDHLKVASDDQTDLRELITYVSNKISLPHDRPSPLTSAALVLVKKEMDLSIWNVLPRVLQEPTWKLVEDREGGYTRTTDIFHVFLSRNYADYAKRYLDTYIEPLRRFFVDCDQPSFACPMSLSESSIVELKKQLANNVASNRVSDIKHILLKLRAEVVATEELIRETKIGLSVGKLRTHADREISELAKGIVKKWRNDVGPVRTATSTVKGEVKDEQSPVGSSRSPSVSAASTPRPAATTTSSLKPETISRKPSLVPKDSSAKSPEASGSNGVKENRSAAKDGQKFDLHHDKTRDKCMELVYDALVFDSDSPAELIFERATAIEAFVFSHEDSDTKYRTKMRSLFLNLKDKNNPGLRQAVVEGSLPIEKLCVMTPQEMASEEKKEKDRAMMEENLFKARGAGNVQSQTDTFKCGRCGQRKCTYYQMQTRSADEPMTTFVTCTVCQNKWKFC